MQPINSKALAAYSGNASASHLPIVRQSLAAASANNSTVLAGGDADVSISEAAKVLQQVSDSQEGSLPGITVLYGAAKLQAPAGASTAQNMAYQRNGLAVDTSSQPWRLVGTDVALNEQSWSAAEGEIDQIVAGRVALYQQEAASGSSEKDIIDKLIAYNRTLAERYTNLMGPAGDIKQLKEQSSLPAGSASKTTQGSDSSASQSGQQSTDALAQDRSAWLRTRLKSLV